MEIKWGETAVASGIVSERHTTSFLSIPRSHMAGYLMASWPLGTRKIKEIATHLVQEACIGLRWRQRLEGGDL
jgi:hypothetical protein